MWGHHFGLGGWFFSIFFKFFIIILHQMHYKKIFNVVFLSFFLFLQFKYKLIKIDYLKTCLDDSRPSILIEIY